VTGRAFNLFLFLIILFVLFPKDDPNWGAKANGQHHPSKHQTRNAVEQPFARAVAANVDELRSPAVQSGDKSRAVQTLRAVREPWKSRQRLDRVCFSTAFHA
jgi:hypothetical protein